jgi:hypothetical protein
MPVSVSVQWFQGALTVRDGCVYGRKGTLRDLTVLTSIICVLLCYKAILKLLYYPHMPNEVDCNSTAAEPKQVTGQWQYLMVGEERALSMHQLAYSDHRAE